MHHSSDHRAQDSYVESPEIDDDDGDACEPQSANTLMPQGSFRGSRLSILLSLPAKQRWRYFRDQLMWRVVATMAALAVTLFLAVHILVPTSGPKLYVAVINDALDSSSSQSFQRSVAAELKLPEGRHGGVLVDSSFDLSADGLSKLQTMLSNHDIDVIIANRSAFARLAGYGYLVPMTSQLTTAQRVRLRSDLVAFRGYDDSDHKDAFYDGSGHGVKRNYGLRLDRLRIWNKFSSSTTDTFMGIAQESQNHTETRGLISYLTQR